MKYWDDEIINKIRKGYYTAVYFNRTKYILEQEKNYKKVTMQIFQRNDGSILCGIDEVIELLEIGAGYWVKDRWTGRFNQLNVKALSDGDKISSLETVMHITGPYVYFAHLESLYLGILARRTLVAANVRKVVEEAAGKPVLFFADRFDYFLNQEGDGYAAHVGGAAGVCTEAHTVFWEGKASGTIPHALIAVNDGSTVKSVKQFAKYYGHERIIALVDFDNDCVKTSLIVARILKNKLWGVRLDTAENMIDTSLKSEKELKGVNPTLVKLVRKALDSEGFNRVKIIVSGGFNVEKIKWFEEEKAPVDIYAVGSALVHGSNDFTADVVMVEGRKMAKVGREYRSNNRLKNYK